MTSSSSLGPLVASWVLVLAVSAATAPQAEAERVVFRTGRSMRIESHRIDGASITLRLRHGGEIVCELAVVARIVPDVVPAPSHAGPAVPVQAVVGAAPYRALVAGVAAREGVDAGLIHAVIAVESAYRPEARSPKGAMGLMQLMPDTARQYAVTDPYDPRSNVEAGAKHLRYLLDRFELPVALAAYNAGEGAVAAYAGIPPYPETRAYVTRILQRLGVVSPTE